MPELTLPDASPCYASRHNTGFYNAAVVGLPRPSPMLTDRRKMARLKTARPQNCLPCRPVPMPILKALPRPSAIGKARQAAMVQTARENWELLPNGTIRRPRSGAGATAVNN